jgi:hypothetical protein
MHNKNFLIVSMLLGLLFCRIFTFGQNTNMILGTGNVGIGTCTPTTQLQVVGSTTLNGAVSATGAFNLYNDLRLWNYSAAGAPTRLLGVAQDGKVQPIGNESVHLYYLAVDSGVKVGDSSITILGSNNTFQNNHIFATHAPLIINGYQSQNVVNQNLLMNSYGGNVGIGYLPTNLPTSAKLSVNGSSYFTGPMGINTEPVPGHGLIINGLANQTSLLVENLQTSPNGYCIRDIVRSPNAKAFSVTYNDNNTSTADPETFTVLGNGVTNISGSSGTYQNVAQLYVETGLGIGCQVKTTSDTPGKIAYLAEVRRSDTRAMTVIYNDNNPGTPDPETFVVTGDGITKVGQVSNAPSSQLSVQTALDVACYVKTTNTGAGKTAILADVPIHDSKAISITRTNNNNPPVEVFRVTGGGVAWMQEIRVRVAPFPDYVFEKGYDLMDLDSLERYIVENHKLPGMPSAAEVAENDANLGELVRLQQEKIEELTLYLIELKKQLDSIKSTK